MKDNFSTQSEFYSKYRPGYPANLYSFLLNLVKNKEIAWDCATGNGQVAFYIADYFKKVYATDISQSQLKFAIQKPTIEYIISAAEKTDFPDSSFDLITVAQAVHWFHFDSFYNEVHRVAKPNALLAIWGYGLISITPDIDSIILELYKKIIGEYWDEERKYIDSEYKTVPFPYQEIDTPHFAIELYWNLKDLEGYLTTWSSVQKFISHKSYNPITDIIEEIRFIWKEEELKKIIFPIFTKIASVKK